METPDINISITGETILGAAVSQEMAEYAASILSEQSPIRIFYINRMIVDICKHKSFNHFNNLQLHDVVVIEGILYQVIKENFDTVELESLTPNAIKRSLSKNAFVQIIK